MPPIDPRFQKAKRYPLHAAAFICAVEELKRLLNEDAAFHVVRKIPDLELSVLHSACSSRHGFSAEVFGDIVKLLIEVSRKISVNISFYFRNCITALWAESYSLK